MINYDDALYIALDHIKPDDNYLFEQDPEDGLVLAKSVEFDAGWLFYFVSRKFMKTRDNRHRLIGSGPVIVGKNNGELYQGGSWYTEEDWINQFKDFIQPK